MKTSQQSPASATTKPNPVEPIDVYDSLCSLVEEWEGREDVPDHCRTALADILKAAGRTTEPGPCTWCNGEGVNDVMGVNCEHCEGTGDRTMPLLESYAIKVCYAH